MKANKNLGQNFLINANVRKRIIASCRLTKADTVLEIGPGQGALTGDLLAGTARVFAVEADSRLAAELQKTYPDRLTVICGDFLQTDLSFLPPNTKVIGNIPYYISTPILEKLIVNRHRLTEGFLTVQREFGQRLAARPHNKDYGALTCYLRYFAETRILFKIGSQSFRPVPKVTSCLMHLKFRKYPLRAMNEDILFQTIRTAFLYRRKKLSNALSGLAPAETLQTAFITAGVPPDSRAENLSLDDYIRLADSLTH